MKKIITPTGFYRLEGIADKDGINMVSKFGYDFMASIGTAVRTTADQNGVISCKKIGYKEINNEFSNKVRRIGNRAGIICSIAAALCFVLTIIFTFFSSWAYQLTFSLTYLMIAAGLQQKGVGIFVTKLFGNKEIKEFTRYHAAKNAVINAYYETGKVPTLEEVKKYSIFNHLNEYVKHGYLSLVLVACSVLRFLPAGAYFLIAITLIAMVDVLERKKVMRFWQFLVTSKPNDSHYRVAIAALEEVIKFFDEVVIKEEQNNLIFVDPEFDLEMQ